ncbi:MAG: TolC family protein [Candidatus Rokubacteria bacterium]|nr:TolC family protein [Candidatus Rokubacteria bacterium]
MRARCGVRAGAVGAAALLLVGIVAPARGQEPNSTRVMLTLRDAVKIAVTRSPEVKSGTFDVEALLGKKQQADAARLPQITAVGVVGPSPEAERRDPSGLSQELKSVNVREGGVTSAYGSADLLLIQPIYTFGLISNLRAAAEHGVKAGRAGVEKTASDVALRVREAYYGLLLFKDLKALLADLHEQLLKAADRLELLLEGGFASEQDLFKLRTFQGELEKNLNLANRGVALAKEALRTWTGQSPDADVDAAEEKLVADLKDFPGVDFYIEEARRNRPEFIQLREGLRAKKALVEAARAQYWPTIFFGIQGSVAYAPNRDRVLNNAVVQDPLRHSYIGPVVGLKYDTDFGITAGKIREAQAEVGKLKSLQTVAEEGIPLEVQKAYGELQEAKQNVQALEKAYANAKKWVVTALANFDLGIGETRDLADAVLAMAKTRADYFQAVFSYQMGVARLDHAAGRDVEGIRALVAEEHESVNAEVTR